MKNSFQLRQYEGELRCQILDNQYPTILFTEELIMTEQYIEITPML